VLEQIAGPDHDYTKNNAYQRVAASLNPEWSDPYYFGADSIRLATYSFPVFDDADSLAAVCGLDIDLSWLGDTLNSRHRFKSTYGLLLTKEGELVAGPPESKVPETEVDLIVDIINGKAPESMVKGKLIRTTHLNRPPYWQLARVYSTEEVFARIRRIRLQNLLMVLLGLAILAFMINRYARNEKRLRETTAEQARIAGELEVARKIQQEMLPRTRVDGVYGTLEPALEVGGDLYDYYIRDGKLFFCIGDVSGKGVPSAMLMSVIHSLFRTISAKMESPSFILRALNENLCRDNESNMFVTFFAGCLDLYTGKLHFANAGHDKPFLITQSASVLPVKANLPLGVFPGTAFEEQECTLSPGDALLLYTDGLTEAKDQNRKNFGRDRVRELLDGCIADAGMTPEKTVQSLSQAAHSYSGQAPQSDDLTMLLVKYEPGELLQDRITLSNDTADVERLSAFVKDFCGRLKLDHKAASSLRLALEESVVNAMNYAYPAGETGEITVYADSNRREVRFTVVDSGWPFDPTTVLSADTTLDAQNRPIGGLGIHLTRKLMDSVSYCRKGAMNVSTLTKSII
jgi:serine phosphatase RsbU (regulator of sigma subunit)/anti-sigma regulatory factor (Ser/Thr protein kinase)